VPSYSASLFSAAAQAPSSVACADLLAAPQKCANSAARLRKYCGLGTSIDAPF